MNAPTFRCDTCSGRGELFVRRMYSPEEGPQYGICPACRGEGAIDIDELLCAECGERAWYERFLDKPFCSEACRDEWRRSWGYDEEEGVA